MPIEEFGEELEYDDIGSLKQWLLYETGDDLPIKLDAGMIKIETKDNVDVNDAIDDLLVQFSVMEESKKGKLE